MNLDYNMQRTVTAVFGAAAIVLSAGCANEPLPAVETARQNYLMTSQDPVVAANAPADLHDAEKTLHAAEEQWQKEDDYDEATHLAYLTNRKLELAKAQADKIQAQKQIANVAQERERAQIQSRDMEIAKLQERLNAKRTQQGVLITLGDVLFDTGKAQLKPGAMQNLYPMVEYLRQHPQASIKIVGHTDDRGSSSLNEELSQRRAESVGTFLRMNGIEGNRIIAQGAGESMPVASNATAAGRQENRRVEVTISNDPGSQPQLESGLNSLGGSNVLRMAP